MTWENSPILLDFIRGGTGLALRLGEHRLDILDLRESAPTTPEASRGALRARKRNAGGRRKPPNRRGNRNRRAKSCSVVFLISIKRRARGTRGGQIGRAALPKMRFVG